MYSNKHHGDTHFQSARPNSFFNGHKILICLSVFNIFIWLLCTTFSAMILIRFNSPNSLIRFASLDLISPGVWGSLFHGVGGILGICAAYEKRQTLLVGTLVLAMLAIFSSIGIGAVSGAMAVSPRFRSYHNSTWLGLEWTLFVLSIMGFIVNLCVFVAVSVLICRPCCPANTNNCRSQNAPNFNNNNTQTNSNYMGSEMMGNILPPAPPPAGFIINPPLTLSQQHSSVQQHQQQNYNSSSPLPNVLVTSATNI